MLGDFRSLLRQPDTVGLLALAPLIDRIGEVSDEGSEWALGLRDRSARV